ncbi:universal stress protein [Hyphomicrobium sp.]|uniref:universal stress protein n=1 Tax=Hyphomicrobium sp. TaxID=82 RepID=UPI0025C4F668|nr:universal stress protein [Hyphomicrobium sp.]MCC7250565.1 universal stress protein [Hyphomicrobium sp.]
MFKHILIATDGSDLAEKAVEQGLNLAKGLGAKVTAVTVTPSWAATVPGEVAVALPVEEYMRATKENATAILSSVEAAAKRVGVACVARHETDRFPAEGIIAAATETGCDLIVMSSHGRRGLRRLLLGSQALEVLTHSTVPVLICR